MKVSRRQLRKIIAETLLRENLDSLVKKYASAGKSINSAIKAAMEDAKKQGLDIDEKELAVVMEDYYDEMMGV